MYPLINWTKPPLDIMYIGEENTSTVKSGVYSPNVLGMLTLASALTWKEAVVINLHIYMMGCWEC